MLGERAKFYELYQKQTILILHNIHCYKGGRNMINFDKIWDENKEHLQNFIATKVPQKEVADILQNVSLEFHTSIQLGRTIRNPKNWLFQVSRNLIADFYKMKSRAAESELNFTNKEEEELEACICDIFEMILSSVLPAKYSTPLIMSDIQNISQIEIAKKLDLSYENTKSRIQRARKMIKEKVSESVDLSYNERGQIIGGMLKAKHNLPSELVEKVKKLELEF